jgi:hypothetical protein
MFGRMTHDSRPRTGRVARDVLMALAGGAIALALVFAVQRGTPTATTAAPATTTSTSPASEGPSEALATAAVQTLAALATDAPEGALANSTEGLGAFPVRDVNGNTVPIVNAGEPAIVMINSRTCGYCKQALRDLGAYAKGRPVPGLRMLTLEGAADGAPMLAAAGITGATPLGPATSQSQVLLTFRYRGTPTFVAVDAQGHIRGTMPGYPGAQQLAPWFDVMLGDRAAP